MVPQFVAQRPQVARNRRWPARRWPTRRWPTRRWPARRWPARRWPVRVVGSLIAVAATLALGACSSSRDGYLAVAMDPAGRLLAVVALCDGQQLASLTLTDETSGTSTTARPDATPEFGGTVILTAPIDNPRPEGALDLLDRGHDYKLSGTVRAADAEADDTSPTSELRFTLDTVVTAKGLRAGSVYAASEDSDAGAEIKKEDFLARARDECG